MSSRANCSKGLRRLYFFSRSLARLLLLLLLLDLDKTGPWVEFWWGNHGEEDWAGVKN